jgi:DNA-binding NarL/FixJ family response regulator
MQTPQVSVLVIEKHPMLREALCVAIESEPGWRIIESLAESWPAVERAQRSRPTAILFSVGNPGLDDLQALRALTLEFPAAPVLALVTEELPGQRQAALENGARAVLGKNTTRAELLELLRKMVFQALGCSPPRKKFKEALRAHTT